MNYSKTRLKRPPKRRPKLVFKTDYRLMQVKSIASAILLTFIKLPFSFKAFVLSIFEWPLKTGFTVFKIFKKTCTCFCVRLRNVSLVRVFYIHKTYV